MLMVAQEAIGKREVTGRNVLSNPQPVGGGRALCPFWWAGLPWQCDAKKGWGRSGGIAC
jgi:hypothetical protein